MDRGGGGLERGIGCGEGGDGGLGSLELVLPLEEGEVGVRRSGQVGLLPLAELVV